MPDYKGIDRKREGLKSMYRSCLDGIGWYWMVLDRIFYMDGVEKWTAVSSQYLGT